MTDTEVTDLGVGNGGIAMSQENIFWFEITMPDTWDIMYTNKCMSCSKNIWIQMKMLHPRKRSCGILLLYILLLAVCYA